MGPIEAAFGASVSNFTSLTDLTDDDKKITDLRPLLTLLQCDLSQETKAILFEALYKLVLREDNLRLFTEENVLSHVLEMVHEDQPAQLRLAERLIECGCSPGLTHRIFHRLSECQAGSFYHRLAEHAIAHTLPPHFEFDTANSGHASINFATFPHVFPPLKHGYSLFTWLYVDSMDTDMHITLFGVFDSSQKSFTMAYLEKETQCLILQTSLKTSVRFNYKFSPKVWYSVSIAHKRPTNTASARATLYVDSVHIETLKCPYPANCPAGVTAQGFIGTIRDFAPAGSSRIKYRLGQTVLVAQVLTHELIRQYHKLGPEYVGNYQDYLASYLTYEASSDMKVFDEKTGSKSTMGTKNSDCMPEGLLLLSVAGEFVCTDNPSLALGRDAREYLVRLSATGASWTVLNKAVPTISSVSRLHSALGTISGGVTSIFPISFTSNIYKIGGAGVLLYLVEIANDEATLVNNLKICLATVSKSFINSEEFEKTHAYEILAMILKDHDPSHLTDEILSTILSFVGLDRELLINPMAYRFLIADFDLWSRASEAVQRSHLNQFVIFSNASEYSAFNNARLARMHIVRKFLAKVRQAGTPRLLPYYMTALKCLLINDFSTENIRSVSSFIIYMLRRKGHRHRLSMTMDGTRSCGAVSPDAYQTAGLAILKLLEEILCEPGQSAKSYLSKFASTITNRWLLLLLSLSHSRKSAMRILACLLISQGRTYVEKFGGKNEGFIVCEALLERTTDHLWPELITILLDALPTGLTDDPAEVRWTNLVQACRTTNPALRIVNPEIIPVIFTTLRWRALNLMQANDSTVAKSRGHIRTTSLETIMGRTKLDQVGGTNYLQDETTVLTELILTLRHIYVQSPSFRDLCNSLRFRTDLARIIIAVMDDELTILSGLIEDAVIASEHSSFAENHQEHDSGELFPILQTSSATKDRRMPLVRGGSSFVVLHHSSIEGSMDQAVDGKTLLEIISGTEHHALAPFLTELWDYFIHITLNGLFHADDMILPDYSSLPLIIDPQRVVFWSAYQTRVLQSISTMLRCDTNLCLDAKFLCRLVKFWEFTIHCIEDGIYLCDHMTVFEILALTMENVTSVKLQRPSDLTAFEGTVVTIHQILTKVRRPQSLNYL